MLNPPSPMEHIQVSVGPVIAGILGLNAPTLALSVAEGRSSSLGEVLELLEKQSPGALLEPRTHLLHRYIHVRVNRRAVSDLAHPVKAEDQVRVDIRMIEGG